MRFQITTAAALFVLPLALTAAATTPAASRSPAPTLLHCGHLPTPPRSARMVIDVPTLAAGEFVAEKAEVPGYHSPQVAAKAAAIAVMMDGVVFKHDGRAVRT